ncbi:hypothetical protein N1851_015576 [Merluccius polli]|uniref:Integrase catalytic domain-containing protein n=1 Tax=Merluccius polli TaxID=89951 RepID=A0AA47P096_MERPO|nr:hypothetical protein N1851_015576 [Merluccius polli]
MADLPPERMEATPPFTYSDGRNELKRYGLLFTCMCSRVIQSLRYWMTLPLMPSSMHCFIAIRGNVNQLQSDHGTHFVGAQNEFQELMKGIEQERVKELGCSFVMNPPASSPMGGVWERQIRTVRSVLTSILDQSARRLDSSSLRTFLYEVMAIVNSRSQNISMIHQDQNPYLQIIY